jgi:hypothetical protein
MKFRYSYGILLKVVVITLVTFLACELRFTAVLMKIHIFWHVVPYQLVNSC